MTIRKMVTAKRTREIDESTLSTAPEDCLGNFLNLKEIRKEQKTCPLNLARGKDVFAILTTGFGNSLFFLAVYTSGKSYSEFRSYDNR